MPPPGVWLLTGENGTGKTTLLACIRRIGSRHAFPIHFPTSAVSDRLDSFSRSEITYSVNDAKVTYAYAGERWVPRPRKNVSVLDAFGYTSVVFVGATADRITPKPEDFSPSRVHAVKLSIKNSANEIFGTKKFDTLRRVNVTRGQNEAFVFLTGKDYYSEKNFSLGELCVLKLLLNLDTAPANSLVVIDELEMALHPSAQVRLFHYLNKVSAEKRHTIIFSTHSVSLIKTSERKNIIFLRWDDGSIIAERAPYLSVVLGGLAFVEEKSADSVIYVEDEMAEYVTAPLIQLTCSEIIKNGSHALPKIEVVPIGGFAQVIAFLKKHEALHRQSVKSFALLDGDVKTETLENWKNTRNYEKLAWFDEYKSRIQYLPWAPEVGIYERYRSKENDYRSQLRSMLNENQLQFSITAERQVENNNRNQCKKWVDATLQFWDREFAIEPSRSKKALCEALAAAYFKSNRANVLEVFAPMAR